MWEVGSQGIVFRCLFPGLHGPSANETANIQSPNPFSSRLRRPTHPAWPVWLGRSRVINHSLFGPGVIVQACPAPALVAEHRGPGFFVHVPGRGAHLGTGGGGRGPIRKSWVASKTCQVKVEPHRLQLGGLTSKCLVAIFKVSPGSEGSPLTRSVLIHLETHIGELTL